ncbi:MAG: DUF4250 domain-containing protein [Clostridia bacterium]|nr:DUF4250 domain-containing protein [Clostridia bacterium]
MLLSMVNMKLRDRYSSLDALCEDWDVSRSEIESVLASLDYHYDPQQNAFI